jgi:hypothetical protein
LNSLGEDGHVLSSPFSLSLFALGIARRVGREQAASALRRHQASQDGRAIPDAVAEYEKLVASLSSTEGVISGRMFGKACLKTSSGKAFSGAAMEYVARPG